MPVGDGLKSQCIGSNIDKPLPARPLLPLAVVLPRVLENIEAELAKERLNLAKEVPLRRRAELIRSLLAPERITKPVAIEIAGAGSGPAPRASAVSPEARNARTCERGPASC